MSGSAGAVSAVPVAAASGMTSSKVVPKVRCSSAVSPAGTSWTV
jgi:hypothetical protein